MYNTLERREFMLKITPIHQKILKQIKKHPNGISTEELIQINSNNSGINHILFELKDEKYLSRLISEEDNLRKAFDLKIVEYSGNWILTDKALAYLTNHKLEFEFKFKLINAIIGFASGIATTIIAEAIILLIFGIRLQS